MLGCSMLPLETGSEPFEPRGSIGCCPPTGTIAIRFAIPLSSVVFKPCCINEPISFLKLLFPLVQLTILSSLNNFQGLPSGVVSVGFKPLLVEPKVSYALITLFPLWFIP